MTSLNICVPQQKTAESGGPGRIIACIHHPECGGPIAQHALAVAGALGWPVTLLHVLDTDTSLDSRPDPIGWDLHQREVRQHLVRLAGSANRAGEAAQVQIEVGEAAEQICRQTFERSHSLLVVGSERDTRRHRNAGGRITNNVLERATGSILLVPEPDAGATTPQYRRILVPMDGSPWAESVLPLATRIAKATGAHIILAHVVPTPELTQTGALEPADLEIRKSVVERNEQTANAYLNRLRQQLSIGGLKVSTRLVRADDVREALAEMVSSTGSDLVIFSARGQGARKRSDVRFGSVAAYLVDHATVPLMIVRPSTDSTNPQSDENRLIGRPVTFASAFDW